MKPREPGGSPGGSGSVAALQRRWNPLSETAGFLSNTLVIAEMEARKLQHDPTELITRAIQPALWLGILGEVFNRMRTIPTGKLPYLDYMAPGILAQSVLFISIFYGIAIIWERDLGIVQKFLVSPTPRAALVSGKALSAGIRGLSQAVIVYALAFALGVTIRWQAACLLGVVCIVLLGAAFFSTMSLIIACIVKTRERFMGIGQIMTMPLFFASNAIYPISMMPKWLQVISKANPLTYEVDALRYLMVVNAPLNFGLLMDTAVLVFATAVFVIIAARVYPNVAR